MKRVFYFIDRPSAKTSLPPELNVQIASALYDYLPSINDAQPMVAWLTVQVWLIMTKNTSFRHFFKKLCVQPNQMELTVFY